MFSITLTMVCFGRFFFNPQKFNFLYKFPCHIFWTQSKVVLHRFRRQPNLDQIWVNNLNFDQSRALKFKINQPIAFEIQNIFIEVFKKIIKPFHTIFVHQCQILSCGLHQSLTITIMDFFAILDRPVIGKNHLIHILLSSQWQFHQKQKRK